MAISSDVLVQTSFTPPWNAGPEVEGIDTQLIPGCLYALPLGRIGSERAALFFLPENPLP